MIQFTMFRIVRSMDRHFNMSFESVGDIFAYRSNCITVHLCAPSFELCCQSTVGYILYTHHLILLFLSCYQELSAKWLSQLLDTCRDRSPTPNTKIIKNICSFACCDPQYTPLVNGNDGQSKKSQTTSGKPGSRSSSPTEDVGVWEWNIGIISLSNHPEQVLRS